MIMGFPPIPLQDLLKIFLVTISKGSVVRWHCPAVADTDGANKPRSCSLVLVGSDVAIQNIKMFKYLYAFEPISLKKIKV